MYQQSNVPSADLGVKVGGDGDLAIGVDTATTLGSGQGLAAIWPSRPSAVKSNMVSIL